MIPLPKTTEIFGHQLIEGDYVVEMHDITRYTQEHIGWHSVDKKIEQLFPHEQDATREIIMWEGRSIALVGKYQRLRIREREAPNAP